MTREAEGGLYLCDTDWLADCCCRCWLNISDKAKLVNITNNHLISVRNSPPWHPWQLNPSIFRGKLPGTFHSHECWVKIMLQCLKHREIINVTLRKTDTWWKEIISRPDFVLALTWDGHRHHARSHKLLAVCQLEGNLQNILLFCTVWCYAVVVYCVETSLHIIKASLYGSLRR